MIEVTQGSSPLVLGLPHTGTDVPPGVWERLNETGRALADTDWHIHDLYSELAEEVTTVRTPIHRYVIDVNRDPAGISLYPGQNTTTLVPLTDFDGLPVWREGQEPDELVIVLEPGGIELVGEVTDVGGGPIAAGALGVVGALAAGALVRRGALGRLAGGGAGGRCSRGGLGLLDHVGVDRPVLVHRIGGHGQGLIRRGCLDLGDGLDLDIDLGGTTRGTGDGEQGDGKQVAHGVSSASFGTGPSLAACGRWGYQAPSFHGLS